MGLKSLLKNFKKEDAYSIAFRQKNCIITDRNSIFKVLPITKNEWYADPILFEFQGQEYLFCEVYDRKKDKGYIGYIRIEELENFHGFHKALITDCHLSYPCVFEWNNEIFMIPETTTNNDIEIFRAENFPIEWEKVKTLKKDGEFADTTIFCLEKELFVMTFEQYKGSCIITKPHIYLLDSLECELKEKIKYDFNFNNRQRGAGKFFYLGNDLIRPSQISLEDEYGYALSFNLVDFDGDKYMEKTLIDILPSELSFDFLKQIKGIHSYAIGKNYEIIDVKFNNVIFSHQIRRLLRFVKRKIFRGN